MPERYHLIDISGDEAFVRGYVEGFFAGRGADISGVYFGSEFGMEDEGFLARLQQAIGLKVERNLLVVSSDFLDLLEQAVARLPDAWAMRVEARREVTELRFPFDLVSYSRSDGEALKAILRAPPAGARLDPLDIEERDEQADGRGVYAPEHAYKLEVRGVLGGAIAPVLDLHRRLNRYEAVHLHSPDVL